MSLKVQLHTHCHGDPVDHINYGAEKLIDEAKKLKYDVLSITCHRKLLFNEKIKKYAEKKDILLIPGIEFEINKKHILGINVNEEIFTIDTFEKLEHYRQKHPECLIIAPHPFFPTSYCLKKDLASNINLFDAVELSWAYTKTKNYNKKTLKIANTYNKPIVATADCHILSYLDIAYTLVDADKNISSIISAIKNNKIKIHTKPASYLKISRFFLQTGWQNLLHKKR